MLFWRKLGKIICGSATPAQLMLAAVLGSTLGFMPGFVQAPGLIAVLVLALVILNANLALAAIVGVGAGLLSLLLMPVSFAIGRLLLDGPTQPMFEAMINAPVLALFGFEYYATTGGLVFGLIFGLVAGVAVVGGVKRFRRWMATLETDSERFRQLTGKGWVRAVLWVLVGGVPKEGYAAALLKRCKVIRPIGVGVAALAVVLGIVVQMFFAGPIVTAALKNGLERANGATVNVESADLNLRQGRLAVTGLAMADPNALDRDLIRAARVEADVSGADLLRKRLTLDRITLSEARHDVKRDVPGRIVGRSPEPRDEEVETEPGEKTIEDYIDQAERWKDRLAQVRDWLEKLSGPEEEPAPEAPEAERERKEERLEDRLPRRIRELGYANVTAAHLIQGTPTLTVRELIAEKVRTTHLEDETLDIHGRNLSTHPGLLNESPSLRVTSSAGTLDAGVDLAGASAGGGDSRIAFTARGLSTDRVAGQLAGGGQKPISGGTMDLALNGLLQRTASGLSIDMPLNVTLHDSTVTVPGSGSAPVKRLSVPLGLRGPLGSPRITLDDRKLADALTRAGADALAGKVRGEAGKAIDKATGELTEKLGKEVSDKAGDQLGELGEKASGSVGEAAQKKAKDALRGLFEGGKKDEGSDQSNE